MNARAGFMRPLHSRVLDAPRTFRFALSSFMTEALRELDSQVIVRSVRLRDPPYMSPELVRELDRQLIQTIAHPPPDDGDDEDL
jgi:hypothetical protein